MSIPHKVVNAPDNKHFHTYLLLWVTNMPIWCSSNESPKGLPIESNPKLQKNAHNISLKTISNIKFPVIACF